MASFTGSSSSKSKQEQPAGQIVPTNLSSLCDRFGSITSTPNENHRSFFPYNSNGPYADCPLFPNTYLDYLNLSEPALNELAKFYNQWSSADPLQTAYPRFMLAPFGDVVFKTSIGPIAPLTGFIGGQESHPSFSTLFKEFHDIQYTTAERLMAKRHMFGFFIGVERDPSRPIIDQRGERFVWEMTRVLVRYKQVSRRGLFQWSVCDWELAMGGNDVVGEF